MIQYIYQKWGYKMNNLKLVIIDEYYCDYLRNFDSKVPYNYGKKDTRPFIGVLFNVGNVEYFAPLSSPKAKHLTMKSRIDFLKVDGGNLGVVNFNNMIPVTPNNYGVVNLNRKTNTLNELKYLLLLQNQYKWLNAHCDVIKNRAQNLYNKYNSKKLPQIIYDRCCNFKLLEKACKQYNTTKEL